MISGGQLVFSSMSFTFIRIVAFVFNLVIQSVTLGILVDVLSTRATTATECHSTQMLGNFFERKPLNPILQRSHVVVQLVAFECPRGVEFELSGVSPVDFGICAYRVGERKAGSQLRLEDGEEALNPEGHWCRLLSMLGSPNEKKRSVDRNLRQHL